MNETLWQPATLVPVEDPSQDLPPAASDALYTVYTYQEQPIAVAEMGQLACRPLLVAPNAAAEKDEEALPLTVAAFSHFHALYKAPAVALVDEMRTALPRVIPSHTLEELTLAALTGDDQADIFEGKSLRSAPFTSLGGDVGIIPVTVYVCPDDPDNTDPWWIPAQAGQPVPDCPVHKKKLVPRKMGGA